MRIALIGVRTNSAGTADGVLNAPTILREVGLIDNLIKHADVEDYGDLSFIAASTLRDKHSGIIAPQILVDMIQRTTVLVSTALNKKQFPLIIGGDCPILLGCLLALRKSSNKYGLLFLDGHEDAYPPLASPTGEAADMELSMALGLTGKAELPIYLEQILPLIEPDQLTLLGPRDRSILEREGIASLQNYFEFIDDKSIIAGNPADIGEKSFAKLINRYQQAWLHLDLDILSSKALPAVDYQQPGGLDWHQLEALTRPFFQKDLLIGWDITIYNPDLDPERICAKRIIDFIESRITLFN